MKKFTANEHNTFLKDLEDLSDEENVEEEHSEEDDNIFSSKPKGKIGNEANKNNILLSSHQIINGSHASDFLQNHSQNPSQNNNVSLNKQPSQFASRLLENKQFNEFIKKLEVNILNETNTHHSQINRNSQIYSLISECNSYMVEINQDINLVLKSIKELYAERFPELASIILNPYDYALTVKNLGNSLDLTKIDLSYLPNNNQLSLTVVSSTTSGRPLNREKLNLTLQLCDEVLSLTNLRKKIISYIEMRMSTICPNLSILLGPNLAAKLITAAGGIMELAKMPASNVLVMGSQKLNLEGFSTKGKLHMGYLAELDEVQNTPEKNKMQILRRYAGKAVLMARVDAYRVNNIVIKEENKLNLVCEEGAGESRGSFFENKQNDGMLVDEQNNNFISEEKNYEPVEGLKFKEEIGKKMSKIIDPQVAKLKKPLPRPDEKPRRKRGGKRMRSIKERTALTEMRMMKNRMKFGVEAEIGFRESGKGFGLLGIGGAGSKMKAAAKVQKINTKKQKMVALEESQHSSNRFGNNYRGNNTLLSGTQSNVSFTPVQGIELINPELYEKKFNNVKEKYFSSTSGFSTVINQNKKGGSNIYEI